MEYKRTSKKIQKVFNKIHQSSEKPTYTALSLTFSERHPVLEPGTGGVTTTEKALTLVSAKLASARGGI